MLKDKIKKVFSVIGGSNRKIAEYAGIAGSNVGKLTNGSRVPKRTSSIASQLIRQIVTPDEPPKLPDPAKIAEESASYGESDHYVGIQGLQRAVLRLLINAANNPGSEMLLYSDQSMEWMQASFTPKWNSMMNKCLENNVRIKIVHRDNSTEKACVRAL